MGDFFDTMTIVVVIIMVFIVLVIAIHASARLIQMTFGRKSGLKQKDTAKSNEAVKNAEPVNCIIKYMLLVIDPKATMSGYINNIVDEHLKKYSPEIIKLYEEKKADYGN